jgi:hypothetical protein
MDLQSVAAYLMRNIPALKEVREDVTTDGSKALVFPIGKCSFSITGKQSGMSSKVTGYAMEIYESELYGQTVVPLFSLIAADGKRYGMPAPMRQSSSVGSGRSHAIDLFDEVDIKGLSKDGYVELYEKLVALQSKMKRLIDRFEGEGAGKTDVSSYIAAAKDFRNRWGKGETWSVKAKNVVRVHVDDLPDGVEVGVILNTTAFRDATGGKRPARLGYNMFKSVARKPSTKQLEVHSGYDAAIHGGTAELRAKLHGVIEDFNRNVIDPWRAALGLYSEYRYR